MDNVNTNTTVNTRRGMGERVVKGGRRVVGVAGGAGSLVIFINVDFDKFTLPLRRSHHDQ